MNSSVKSHKLINGVLWKDCFADSDKGPWKITVKDILGKKCLHVKFLVTSVSLKG